MARPSREGRWRASAALALVAVLALGLAAGLAWLTYGAVRGDGASPAASHARASGGTPPPAPTGPAAVTTPEQDALAAAPMPRLPRTAARPQPLVAEVAGPPIVVPAPVPVPAGQRASAGGWVPAHTPRTPEGALAQLVAIDEAALSTTDLGRIHEIYAAAATPGAVAETEWSPAHGIRTLVDRLGGRERARRARVGFQVVQGQIKGSVGGDFVVACVLGQLDVSAVTTARAGVGDCQRMVWRDGRWWIGPGRQPAFPPSAWPGSADAVRSGWRELERVAI